MANKFRESRFRVWDYGNNMYRADSLFAKTQESNRNRGFAVEPNEDEQDGC